MEKINGKAISGGVAIGKIRYLGKEKLNISKKLVDDVDLEIQRFNDARIKAKEQLKDIYIETVACAGKEIAEVFEVQQLILLDEEYVSKIINMIFREGVNAEYAVDCISGEYEEVLKNSESAYLSGRAIDINDIGRRIIKNLGYYNTSGQEHEESIVVAHELKPSEIVEFEGSNVLGFITTTGSVNSHASIIARNMEMPGVTGITLPEIFTGKNAIIDGDKGIVIIEPDDETLAYYMDIRDGKEEIIGDEVVTPAGRRLGIYSNVNSLNEAIKASDNGSDGIGLFRTEIMYMNRENVPSEEEQFEVYREIVEMYSKKRVIIRTLDAGADKKIKYLNLPNEKNPAMGLRGIRFSLLEKEIFKTQLRAIYRASVYGHVGVMFPMITSMEEIVQIKELIKAIKDELNEEGIRYGEVELGVMIETPAAAIISDMLAKEVDFFSIGTNDLTQYTLAIDRENDSLSNIYDPYHQSIIRMIELTVQNAHREKCRVCVCGELAADTNIVQKFIEMEVDELSVSPSNVQKIKKYIFSAK